MRVQTICIFKDSKRGNRKDGSPFTSVKALDDVNDKFFVVFGDSSIADKVKTLEIERNDTISLILDINIGYKSTYITLVDIEKA